MFAIAFILYRITTCFKRIITNAGAKLQNKYVIFLRSTEKFSFLTIIFSYTSFSPQNNRNRPCWCRAAAFLGFSSLEFPFLFRLDLLAGTAVESSSVILLLSAVALTSGSFLWFCQKSASLCCLDVYGWCLLYLLYWTSYYGNRHGLLKPRA